MALFDGHVLLGIQLRRAKRGASPELSAKIDMALADDGFMQDTVDTYMCQAQSATAKAGAIVEGSLIQTFIKLIVDNLPAILALIEAIFVLIPK